MEVSNIEKGEGIQQKNEEEMEALLIWWNHRKWYEKWLYESESQNKRKYYWMSLSRLQSVSFFIRIGSQFREKEWKNISPGFTYLNLERKETKR
jgi:hypothetical protein